MKTVVEANLQHLTLDGFFHKKEIYNDNKNRDK